MWFRKMEKTKMSEETKTKTNDVAGALRAMKDKMNEMGYDSDVDVEDGHIYVNFGADTLSELSGVVKTGAAALKDLIEKEGHLLALLELSVGMPKGDPREIRSTVYAFHQDWNAKSYHLAALNTIYTVGEAKPKNRNLESVFHALSEINPSAPAKLFKKLGFFSVMFPPESHLEEGDMIAFRQLLREVGRDNGLLSDLFVVYRQNSDLCSAVLVAHKDWHPRVFHRLSLCVVEGSDILEE